MKINITYAKGVENILKIYDKSNAKSNWYADARNYANELSKIYDVPSGIVIGVISALSPLKSWEENKKLAISFLKGTHKGHIKSQILKAKKILKANSLEEICTILSGQKTIAFFLNIFNPNQTSVVVIDRHAISIVLSSTKHDGKLTKNNYEFFSNCYHIAASKLGVKVGELQADTWVAWKELKKAQ